MYVPGDRPGTDLRRPDEQWWKRDKRSMHSAIFSTVQYIDEVQSARRDLGLMNLQMYSARLASSFSSGNFQDGAGDTARIKMNVVKSAIDTSLAHIATEKYRPMYLGNGASYEEKYKAQLLTKYMLGQFLYLKRHRKSLMVFRDGAIFSRGFEKFYEDPRRPGNVASERVFPDDIIFDVEETKNSAPRSLFQHKEVAAEVLAARYPKFEKSIMKAQRIRTDAAISYGVQEPVSVLEAWHKPSRPGAKDGVHTICISNRTLEVEPWDWDEFPFSSFCWGLPLLGWLGISAAEELTSIQIEINYIAQKIQRLMTLATSIVWKERGSDLGKLSNRDWGQYEYTGKPPIFQNISSVSAEYFHHLDRLYQRAFELVGTSLLHAQGDFGKLESGAAVRNVNNVVSKRYQHISQQFEDYHMDSADRIFDVSCDIRKAGRDVGVLVPGEDEFEKVLFSKGYLDRSKFLIQSYAAPLLPEEPAGRIDDMSSLAQSFPSIRARLPIALSGYSDMKEVVAPIALPYRIAERAVHNILTGEEYEPPDGSVEHLSIARETAQFALLQSYTQKDISSDKRTLLRRFMAQCDDQLQEQQMMQAPAMSPDVTPSGASPTLTAVPGEGAGMPTPQPMGA